MEKSRTSYVIKNAWIGVLAQSVALVLSFVSRTFFIKILGSEYLGVNGLFTDILTMLSIAELGVGEAIVFNLYKPIAVNDEKKIKTLVKFYKNAYQVIGITIFLVGLCLIPFMDSIIPNKPNISENLILIYILFLANTSISYLYIYKSTILKANQKNYITVIYKQVFHCIQLVLQIILLYFTHDYILYLIIQFACTLTRNIMLSHKASKMYPYLNDKEESDITKEERKEIFAHIKGTFVYKIGSSIINGTDSIIISKYIDIVSVGISSNYFLINTTIKKYLSQITSSFTASLGNSNAIESNEKKENILYQVMYLCFIIYSYASICLIVLSNDLINIWFGKEYLFGLSTVIIIVLNIFFNGLRYPSYVYRSTMGLFQHAKFIPILGAFINIVSSIILAKFMGIDGVYLGTILAIMSTYFIADPVIIYKHVFNKKPTKYFLTYFKYVILGAIVFIITYFITKNIIVTNFLMLIVKLIVTTIISLSLLWSFTFKCDEYKKIKSVALKRFKKLINKFKGKKNGV